MRGLSVGAVLLAACGWAGAAVAQGGIGVAVPLSGPNAVLGRQVLDGAQAAAAGSGVDVVSADDRCTAEGGKAAAEQFVAAKVSAVLGFLCTEATEAALPVLKEAAIPALVLGTRTNSLTDARAKTGWLVVRMAPRADAERTTAAAIIPRLWRDEPFAVVDDGTIYGRELAESVRAAAEERALKPVFVDTFRPEGDNQIGLVGRLRRAGATRVFVGGDRGDVAVMARDAAALGARIVFAGGEALRAEPGSVPLAEGTLMIGLPEPADGASTDAIDAVRARGTVPEGYVMTAYAAAEIIIAAANGTDAPLPVAKLLGQTFQTAIGPVRFSAEGELAADPFRLFRFDGTRFIEEPVP